jgi:DNA-binding NtrC family response regulator
MFYYVKNSVYFYVTHVGLDRLIEVYGTIDDFDMVLSDLQMPVMDGMYILNSYLYEYLCIHVYLRMDIHKYLYLYIYVYIYI